MQTGQNTYQFAGFTLDLSRGCLQRADQEIELRPKSFDMLRYLVENAGRLVSKDELTSKIWPGVVATDESLTRCISDIRLALGDRERRLIKTIPRRGYRFVARVSETAAHTQSVHEERPPATSPIVEVLLPTSATIAYPARSSSLRTWSLRLIILICLSLISAVGTSWAPNVLLREKGGRPIVRVNPFVDLVDHLSPVSCDIHSSPVYIILSFTGKLHCLSTR